MLDHRITAYEGTENYIFISYAHKDSDRVMPILEELRDEGYRIWYDDGIAPGSEWPENIAQHLDGAAMVMAFISANSMASPNCRREINFALSRQKPFLSVVLEQTEISLGMQLQLSAQQSVIRYNYRTEEQFIGKICSCPDLACCRIEPEAEPAPQMPETPPKGEEPPRPPKAPKPKKEKKPRSSKPLGKKLAVAAGVLALIALVCVLFSAFNTVKITDEVSANRKDTYLSLRELTVDSAILERVGKLGKLETLTFTRCRFAPGALEQWNGAASTRYLSFEECEGDLNLAFLTALPGLTRLEVKNCGLTDENLPALSQAGLYMVCLNDNPGLTDLSKLAGLEGLTQLEIGNTGVKSLEAVARPALRQIDFSGTPVKDVAVLENCPDLTGVNGSGSGVTDIAPLARLTGLSSLEFAGCDLSGLSPQVRFASLRLQTLDLRDTGITTLAPFGDLTRITTAYLGGNGLSAGELGVLEKSAETLKHLDLSGTGFRSDSGSWLADCRNLQKLILDNTLLTDLSFAEEMSALETLSANACGLKKLADLSGCRALKQLYLAENELENLSGLEGIVLENADYARFDFTGCEKLRDLSGLPQCHYSRLCLAGCPDIDFATMGNVSGQMITLHYNASFVGSHLESAPFGSYVVLDCPTDRKVYLEERLGRYNVKYVTYGRELAEIMTETLQMPCAYLADGQ